MAGRRPDSTIWAVRAGRGLLLFLGDDLVAEIEALGTDGGDTWGLHWGIDWDRGHAGRLGAVLAAEAAPRPGLRLGHGVQLAGLGGGGLAGGDHAPGQLDAAAADVHARARDQLLDLGLMPAAERADQPLLRLPHAAAQPSAGTARRLDDLVHPLVAQAEAGRELAQGRALQMEPADGPVEVGPGHLGVAFGVDQPLLGADGFGQKLGVHLSTVTRQWTADKGRRLASSGARASRSPTGPAA